MVSVGSEQIQEFRVGEMGARQIRIGDTDLYTRPGGYIYLELNTKEQ